jgi:glucose/arabinose dehydrogenase
MEALMEPLLRVIRCHSVFICTVGLALGIGLVAPAWSQQPAPPPTWKQGQPAEMANSTLAPIFTPPTPMAAEKIPMGKIKVPPGFKVELWAAAIHNARAMTLGSKGTLFVSSRLPGGSVYAVLDRGGKREVKTIAKGLDMPNGVAFRDGALYVAAQNRILRYDGIEDKLDNPGDPVVVIDSLPKHQPHGWKYLAFGPDGKLYFNIGAPCNICLPPETNANISRINADGTGFEYVARGVRNSVGFDWHPVTKELYFTNHGRDWLGEDVPNDTLHQVSSRSVPHFGYPFCHQGDILDPDFGKGRACSEFNPPLMKLGPHIAPIGTMFYTGAMFPAQYKNRLFIVQRGSWNRTEKLGYGIVTVTLAMGQAPKQEGFASGWLENNQPWGRPAYLYQMPDGALLLSDDHVGAIYRISYQR